MHAFPPFIPTWAMDVVIKCRDVVDAIHWTFLGRVPRFTATYPDVLYLVCKATNYANSLHIGEITE